MASIIRIKRSSTSGNPSTLGAGELAYSALTDNGSNGGDRLYIGIGTETAGDAVNHFVIGGKYFTDMLDHSKGTLTANSAIVVDGDKKIDDLLVDNIQINGSTISTTNSNGDLNITPDGTGKLILSNVYVGDSSTSLQEYIEDISGGSIVGGTGITETYDDGAGTTTLDLDDTAVTAGTYGSATAIPQFTVDAQGRLTAASNISVATTLAIAGESGTGSISLLSQTLTVTGGEGIDTSVSGQTITISGEDASETNKGIASFDGTHFTVTSGDVTANDVTFSSDSGSAAATLGETISIVGAAAQGISTSASGTTVTVTAANAAADGSTKGVAAFNSTNFSASSGVISSEDITIGTTALTLGETTTTLAGLQQVDVDNIRIDGNEISSTDTNGDISLNPNGSGNVALNSARITGLADPVNDQDAATKAYVDARAAGLDPKQSVRAATTENITLSNTQTIDGVALDVGDRVLVKDQTDASENGIYVVASGSWSRASDMDEPAEMTAGVFFFVEEGTASADAGFVITTDNPITVGTDDVNFTQFSGAGQIVAGDGLSKSGNTLYVNVANGIEISADNVQLASSVAGDGLTYSSGVVNAVGTSNRISVSADAIDIAATYVGQSSITTLGTIGTGVWQGTVIDSTYGGTGVNNGGSTITIGDDFEVSGAYTVTLTATGATNVTLPTTGTLATLAGTETLTNKTITGATISGGSINNTPIGATTRNSGAFTTLAANGNVSFTATTASSGSGSGALVVAGGVGIGGAVNIASNLTGAGAGTSTLDGFNIDGGTY